MKGVESREKKTCRYDHNITCSWFFILRSINYFNLMAPAIISISLLAAETMVELPKSLKGIVASLLFWWIIWSGRNRGGRSKGLEGQLKDNHNTTTRRQMPRTQMHYKKRMKKKENEEEDPNHKIIKMLSSLPGHLVRDYIYPYAVRVFQNRAQLKEAVNEYMEYIDNKRPFPAGYCSIEHWDVTLVTDFSWLFNKKWRFQGDLSKWDTSNGTNFEFMFCGCHRFNANLSQWNVSSATHFNYMFEGCHSFNTDLSQWDVSSSTDLRSMFWGCHSFNANLSHWDISNARFLDLMFFDCSRLPSKSRPPCSVVSVGAM